MFLPSEDHSLREDPISRALIQAGDQEAQAWSYAAALAAGVNPTLVFDKGNGFSAVLFGLKVNIHPGINGLIAGGMTTRKLFPDMLRWLQI